jgi:hypothetical protein
MLSGQAFSLVHVYASAGTFPVTVTIGDDDVETSTVHTVTVTQPPAPGPDLSQANTLIDQLIANRKISRDFGNLLKAQVREAQNFIQQGRNANAVGVLRLMVIEVDLLVQFRQMTAADAAPLRNVLTTAITQLGATAPTAQKLPLYKVFKSCRSHQRPLHYPRGYRSFRIQRFR